MTRFHAWVPRRAAAAVLVGVILLAVASPSPAAAAWTFTSSIAGGNPGLETHAGIPKSVPGQPPCAIFTAYTYNVALPAGSVTVGGVTFTHVNATVNSAINQWYEGPDGTFTDPTCDTTVQAAGEKIRDFIVVLEGTNASGDVLDCTSGPGWTNYYTRTFLDVDYHFEYLACEVNGTAALGAPTNVHFDLTIATTPLPPDPIFGWNTYCTGPIAPAGCLSEGTVTFS